MICCNCKREISKNYGYNTIGCYCSSCAMQMGLTVEQIILNLQSQLAEKDKEIKRLKKYETIYYINQLQASKECSNKYLQNNLTSAIAININQKAIEQLEKVKELVEEKSVIQSPFGTQKIYASDVSSIIDNQIKQLKELK